MRVFLLIIFLASTQSTPVFATTPGEVEAGGYLRDEALRGFNGRVKKFSNYKGKPLLINVWASWCGPCREEMPSLERLAHRYNGKEFNVIGISTDDDGNAALAFIRQSGVTFENFLDYRLALENMLGANTLPLTILVDAKGKVLVKAHGGYIWDSEESIDGINKFFQIGK